MKRRLAVVTGARSEYGVLKPFLRLAERSTVLELQLVVAGMHFSALHGGTVREIEDDGFHIAARVEMTPAEDSAAATAHWLGRGIEGFADTFAVLRPDLVVVEGDRVEVLAAALAAGYMAIPVAHSGGGDVTRTVDNSARHAISMFAALHFVSTSEARDRLVGFGLPTADVHAVGGLGLDTVVAMDYQPRDAVLADLGVPAGGRYLLITFHPETEAHQRSGAWMEAILAAALATGLHLVVTYPNSDPGHGEIIAAIRACAAAHPGRVTTAASLGQARYLNAMRHAEALVGNSSSGLYEAPSLHIPVIDIGHRQDGRQRAGNILNVPPEQAAVAAALGRALHDPAFRAALPSTVNPFGDGHSAERMLAVIEKRILPCRP